MTAIQNTKRKSFSLLSMMRLASSGPEIEPIVNNARRKPKPAPRTREGSSSASSASRGASRRPLPNRSAKRATRTVVTSVASGNSGLTQAAMP